jgi:hypothetical protein
MSRARLRDLGRPAEPRTGRPIAIALLPGERDLLVAALKAHPTERLRMKADLLHMLEGAPPAADVFRELEVEPPRCARGPAAATRGS